MKNPPTDDDRAARIIAEAHRNREQREKSYRDRALKLFPWVCARCGRDFDGKRVRQLTVHHRDHNHDNNPPDGSNWELLCLYCHENEHARLLDAQWTAGRETADQPATSSGHRPFAGLDALLKGKK
jgi:5-methylcytosine-specific restriction endonuclease McrA